MPADEQGGFCYWDARSLGDCLFIIASQLIVVVYFCIALYRLCCWKIVDPWHRSRLNYLYGLVVLWGVVFSLRKMYGVAVYFTQLRGDARVDMTAYSMRYVWFDTLPGFLVHSMFLQICYLYYCGLLNSMELRDIPQAHKSYPVFFKLYYCVRLVAQAGASCLPLLAADQGQAERWAEVAVWVLVGDAAVVSGFLVATYRLYSENPLLMERLNRQDRRQLNIEYGVMTSVSVGRMLLDVAFLTGVGSYIFTPGSSCLGDMSEHLAYSLFFQIVGSVFNHLLPVGWVLASYDLGSSRLLRSTVSSSADLNSSQFEPF